MKKILNGIKLCFICLLFVTFALVSKAEEFNQAVLDKITKSIVKINSRISASAYGATGNWSGTGFITGKDTGLIITNRHVTGGASIGNYLITFHNGKQTEGKVLYYDIWQDYAILKVDPKEVPDNAPEISFSQEPVKLKQEVIVVGNTEAQDFSFHSGYVSGLYDINGDMPECSYVINLNITGGASGSPVLNHKGEAIGVLYGGGQTYALALHGSYVTRALDPIKKGDKPIRKHVGIITELYSLDKAVKHRNFPQEETDRYVKLLPDTRNRAVAVQSVIPGTPAYGILRAGDILLEINGKAINGNLSFMDAEMDGTVEKNVRFTIYRDGDKLNLSMPLYDVNAGKIERAINFGGAIFFESDDYLSFLSGIPKGALSIANVQTGSGFSSIPVNFRHEDKTLYRIKVTGLNKIPVNNLNDLIKSASRYFQDPFSIVKIHELPTLLSAIR